jgi:hypothetical protein
VVDTLQLFRNGALVKSVAVQPLSAAHVRSGGVLRLGGDHRADQRFKGSLSELRVWSRALSAAELTRGMTRRARGDEPALLSCYPLDQVSSPPASSAPILIPIPAPYLHELCFWLLIEAIHFRKQNMNHKFHFVLMFVIGFAAILLRPPNCVPRHWTVPESWPV